MKIFIHNSKSDNLQKNITIQQSCSKLNRTSLNDILDCGKINVSRKNAHKILISLFFKSKKHSFIKFTVQIKYSFAASTWLIGKDLEKL